MRGKSPTCREAASLFLRVSDPATILSDEAVVDRQKLWGRRPASRRLAAHQRGRASSAMASGSCLCFLCLFRGIFYLCLSAA